MPKVTQYKQNEFRSTYAHWQTGSHDDGVLYDQCIIQQSPGSGRTTGMLHFHPSRYLGRSVRHCCGAHPHSISIFRLNHHHHNFTSPHSAPTTIMSSNKYIVVFKKDVSQEDIDKFAEQVNQDGGQVTHKYDTVLKGFAAHITDSTLQSFQSLQGDIIDYIEPDGVVTTQ
ncbi:hypothetical protein HGRIS_002723 [Hohenbuehelia grisea]|uniref:Inhibitor I9 domain-containing protein n=1 Tax=Hohenbuehelia grisea TaxID=104357 RepID=A0ABR3JLA4_9AGAR